MRIVLPVLLLCACRSKVDHSGSSGLWTDTGENAPYDPERAEGCHQGVEG